MLGARPDGREDLLRVRRREHEHHVPRCLFQRLQEGVRGGVREHVDLVEDVHLGACTRPEPERRALDDVADVLDAAIRRRVELEEVEEGARRDRHTDLALTARVPVVAERRAVERLREQTRGRRLPGPARSGEEVRMPDASVAHRGPQRTDDVLLADDLREALRPVLPVQRLVGGHAPTVPAVPCVTVGAGELHGARAAYDDGADRARRGARGALYPKSTFGGLNSRPRLGPPPTRLRARRRRSGPAQQSPANRVRSGRKQLSADRSVCRRYT